MSRAGRVLVAAAAVLAVGGAAAPVSAGDNGPRDVHPSLRSGLVAFYDSATDETFQSGRVGFGSFDNIGRARAFRVVGTPAPSSPAA
jgi:hypothetical protein